MIIYDNEVVITGILHFEWVGEPSPDPSTLSIARQFVGSFSFNSYTAQDGKHLLNIIYDTKNIRSLFYHIIGTDYLNHSRNSFFKPLSNTYQFYIWKSKK